MLPEMYLTCTMKYFYSIFIWTIKSIIILKQCLLEDCQTIKKQ